MEKKINRLKIDCLDLDILFTEINNVCNEKDRASKSELRQISSEGIKAAQSLCNNIGALKMYFWALETKLKVIGKAYADHKQGKIYIDDMLKTIERLLNDK